MSTNWFPMHFQLLSAMPNEAQCPLRQQENNRYVRTDQPEAATALNDSLISLLNAFPVKTAKGIVDGVIVWQCGA